MRQAHGRDEGLPPLGQVIRTWWPPWRRCWASPPAWTLAHHNCVMTKHPHFGSQTGWHRDTRYWSFVKPELVTVWLALGDEDERNGVLRVIPGSHQAKLAPEQLDPAEFLIEAHPAIARACSKGRCR